MSNTEAQVIPTPEQLAEREAGDLHELKQIFDMDSSKGSLEIANHLVRKYHIKTVGEHDREIFIYQNGVYQLGIDTIRKWLHILLKEKCKTHTKKEIIEKIKDLSAIKREDFVVDASYINLNNGILDLKTLTLLPHDPTYLFLKKIPVDYIPNTECNDIKKFLNGILDNKSIQVIQEFIGFGLYRRYFIKKAMILVGERNTGKTTLLKVINNFFGTSNVSGVSLQKITTDKFSPAQLYQKNINIFDDLSFKDINDTGAFKIATGGGSITAEYKFGNQFQFENYAKLIFACNKIPDVKDTEDEAYFGRWILVRFNKEIKKADNFLLDKLTTAQELSGLLNFALDGLIRLLKNGEFSYEKEPHEIKDEMMRSSSALAGFVTDTIESKSGAWISKTELYTAFKDYAEEKRLTVLTKANFGKKITNYAPYIQNGRKKFGKNQKTGWLNVKMKNSDDVEDFFDSIPEEDDIEPSTDSMDI